MSLGKNLARPLQCYHKASQWLARNGCWLLSPMIDLKGLCNCWLSRKNIHMDSRFILRINRKRKNNDVIRSTRGDMAPHINIRVSRLKIGNKLKEWDINKNEILLKSMRKIMISFIGSDDSPRRYIWETLLIVCQP